VVAVTGSAGKSTTKASGSPVVKVRKYYRVRAGDTLSVIAEKFHTTENQLMITNDLSSTTLRVGQRLKLPSPAP
jgi:LysM repeat protein